MAIGDVKINVGRGTARQPRAVPGQFGEGVGRALQGMSNTIQEHVDLQERLARRKKKEKDFKTEEQYFAWQGAQERAVLEAKQASTAGAANLTNDVMAMLRTNQEEFISGVDPTLQDKYRAKTERDIQSHVTSALGTEITQGNNYFRNSLTVIQKDLGSRVEEGLDTPEVAIAKGEELINASDLHEAEKITRIDALRQVVLLSDFKHQAVNFRSAGVAVRPADGSGPVLAGINGGEFGALQGISETESKGQYNLRYNGTGSGAVFEDFSDHPRIFITTKDGRQSSAAGRYMITATTWDWVAPKLGLKDFSPENQDKAAIWLMNYRYNAAVPKGSPPLKEVLQSGDRAKIGAIREILLPEWAGLSTLTNEQFADAVMSSQGPEGQSNDLINDPRYDSIPYDQRVKILNDAATKAAQKESAARTVATRQHKEYMEAQYAGAQQGELGRAQVDVIREAGGTAGEINTFLGHVKDYEERVLSVEEITAKLNDPESVFTSEVDDEGLNNMLKNAEQFLGQRSQQYLDEVLMPLVQKTNFIPSDSAAILVSMASGTGPNYNYAMEALAKARRISPMVLEKTAGLSREQKNQIAFFSAVQPYKTVDEFTTMITQFQDPNFAAQRLKLMKEGRDFALELDIEDTMSKFDPGLFDAEPQSPLGVARQAVFNTEFNALYAEGWAISGKKGEALDYAVEAMKGQWEATSIGDPEGEPRLMRNPPSQFYGTVNQSMDWIDYVVRRDNNLRSDQAFALVADSQTQREGELFRNKQSAQNASYMITVQDAEGNTQVLLNEKGEPRRMYFDANDEEIQSDVQWIVSYENLLKRAQMTELRATFGGMEKGSEAQKALVEEALHMRQQLVNMREGRQNDIRRRGVDDTVIGGRLLADMEQEAEEMYQTITGTTGVHKSLLSEYEAQYDQLREDILNLGGKAFEEIK